MSFLTNLFSSLSFPKNLAGDFSLLFLFIGLSIALGFIFGRWKLVNILIDIYISIALVSIVPKEVIALSPFARTAVFLAILILLSAIDSRLFDVHITSAGTDFFWRLFVMSILVTGSLVSATLSFLPKNIALSYISPTALGYFASPMALLFWMVIPLLLLLFINNRLK
jgi:hypothetical protein